MTSIPFLHPEAHYISAVQVGDTITDGDVYTGRVTHIDEHPDTRFGMHFRTFEMDLGDRYAVVDWNRTEVVRVTNRERRAIELIGVFDVPVSRPSTPDTKGSGRMQFGTSWA